MGVPTYWTDGNKENFETLPSESLITGVGGFVVLVNNLKEVKPHYEKLFGNSTSQDENKLFYQLETNFVKVIQPLEKSGYSKLLAQSGEGVQILNVKARETNVEKAIANFSKKGFEVLEQSKNTVLFFHHKLPFQIEIAL